MSDDTTQPPKPPVNYNSYLRVPQLLELQQLESEPPAHDELLFITIHQAYELWFKQILFELETVGAKIDADDIPEATRLVRRVIRIEQVLVDQIHILESMTPRDFLSFRKALNPASGFQSVQFREVEFMTGMKNARALERIEADEAAKARLQRRFDEPSLRERFFRLLQRRGFDVVVPDDLEPELSEDDYRRTMEALAPLYAAPEKHFRLYDLAESLVEHDQYVLLWRFHHVRVVERLIGTKMGTGGSPGVKYLESTLMRRAFPLLWAVRGELSDEDFYGTSRGPTQE